MTTKAEFPVAKKQHLTEADSQVEKTTTKVDKELLARAKAVASIKRLELFDYIDGLLRTTVEREYKQLVRDQGDH